MPVLRSYGGDSAIFISDDQRGSACWDPVEGAVMCLAGHDLLTRGVSSVA